MESQNMHRHMKNACLTAILANLFSTASVVHAGSTIFVTTINQEINNDSFCSLQEAIYAANLDDNKAPDIDNPGQFIATGCEAGNGADVIELPPGNVFSYADPITDADNFVGPSATPIITSTITIEGRGAKLERVSAGRPTRAFVVGPSGFLDLREVHVEGFFIHGGNGAIRGGGGGMGAGGAIYVQGGRLLAQWSTFEGNGVRGGDGGDGGVAVDGGGGGGGLSGNGGEGGFSGGGGGGSRGDGGNAHDLSLDYRGGGGGGRVTSGSDEAPGQPCGGAGGESGFGYGVSGDSASLFCPGGGGGGGSGTSDLSPGDGGAGSYGGGGGGGGGGGFLASGNGGDGGFGGGGGGANDNEGGDGGFGGGGGCGFEAFSVGHGQGGTFAGDGGTRTGGGGAGLGGAIFGYLADIDIVNSTFTENWAERGQSGIACGLESCGPEANDGRGAGGAIFTVAGDLRVVNSTIAGNEAVTVTNGGGGGIVVYDPIGDDEATFVLRNSIVAYNGASECYTRNGVTTSGSEGNIITDSTPNNLDNPPCPGVVTANDPLLENLEYNPPGTTPTMMLDTGSPAIDAAVGAFPADDQRGILRPQGEAADIGAVELSSQPPTTTISLAPATPNGANGWYVSAVGVTISATDPEQDVAQTRCVLDPASAPSGFADLPDANCALTGVSADGEHAIYAASIDDQGNAEDPVVSATFKLDGTDPTLSPSLNVPTPITVGQTGVAASPNASDATSGVASSSCGVVDTSTPGVHTVSCTATDNAGNTAAQDLTYVVEYRILGFFSPVPESHWKIGQRVPVKIALANGAGDRISDAEATALAAACRVTFQASGAQSKGPDCMKYDFEKDQFVYTWKLGKNGTGAATIVVRISYPGTAVQTQLSESITIIR
jgi:hypothetical protein